jgi:hypothetical protein
LNNIVGDPWKYGQNLAANASRIFFNAPYSRRPLTLRAAVFLIPGALLLMLFVLASARLARGRVNLPPEGAAFAAFVVAAFLVHLPISAYVRMLIPMVPPMIWLIVQVFDRSRAGAARAVPAPSSVVAP